MKYKDFEFRKLDGKTIKICGLGDKVLEKLELSEPVLGYSYIDLKKGQMVKILGGEGNKNKYISGKLLTIKGNHLAGCDIEILEKGPLDERLEIHYANENILEIRSHSHLDKLRKEYEPDDIKIVIPYEEGYVEEMYVGSVDYIKSADTYIFTSKKEAVYHKDIKEGSLLACKYVEQGNKNAMIFIGMAEEA